MTENIDVVVPEPLSAESDVEITIRQAYQTENDFKFSCPTIWTIKRVKEHVRNCLDNHPAVSTQRLIFSGAVLTDEQILSNVLKDRSIVTGEQIFFHLMISQPYQDNAPGEVRNRRNVNNSEANTATPQQPAQNGNYEAYAQNMVAWNQYWAAYNNLSPDDQFSEQHRLMAHYYTYMLRNPAAQAPTNSPQNMQQNAEAWRARIQGNVIPGMMAAGIQNPGAAAAAAPAARQGRVDILEVGYRIFKLVLLFSAILLYSSFERFALVLCSALFIYFIQLRRNHARAQAQAAAPAPAQNQEPHVNNNNNGENEGENAAPAGDGETPEAPAEPPVAQQSGMQIFVATIYSFVTSFFASLVPDHPMPMDLN